MASIPSFEENVARGEELLREIDAVPPCRGRRAEDAHREEILVVREFLSRFTSWDHANEAELRRVFAGDSRYAEQYRAVAQPDHQLALTDFQSMKARVQRAIVQKLDLLRAFRRIASDSALVRASRAVTPEATRVFIGHGRSPQWRELKDYVHETLGFAYEEFDREPTAGMTVTERLAQMLAACDFALIVMTAEDEHADGSRHARENVIHEAGLFQGKLGFRRAIVLIEEGCAEFSNIEGLVQVRFPERDIRARFEDVRRLLVQRSASAAPAHSK